MRRFSGFFCFLLALLCGLLLPAGETSRGLTAFGTQPEPLTIGESGDRVRIVQEYLYRMGFTAASPDGQYGDRTDQALRLLDAYAAQHGFTPDAAYSNLALLDGIGQETGTGDAGGQVRRVQTRLYALGYLAREADGQYGENTARAVTYFCKRNGLPASKNATRDVQRVLFSDGAVRSDVRVMPYRLIVDVSDQKVYALDWNGGSFDKVVRKMKCSTGKAETPTPLGTYTETTGRGERWHYFQKWECWAQYAYTIQGDILFHSVLYSAQNEDSLMRSSVHNLGARASHGCVRLSVEDAKWIWDNCPAGTTVIVRD